MVSESPVKDDRVALSTSTSPVEKFEDTCETEEHMCMRGTIPQHIDDHFSKLEDLAGTGEFEAFGG